MSFLNKFKREFEGLNFDTGRPQASPSPQNQNQAGGSYSATSASREYGHNQQQQRGYSQGQQHQAFQYPNQQQVQWPIENIASLERTGYQPPALAPPSPSHSPSHGGHHPPPPGAPPPINPGHQDLIASPLGPFGSHSLSPVPLVGYGGLPQSAPSCPTPPRWIPYYSESNGRWYFVETTGRSSWDAPGNLPPLPAMPPYPGISSLQVAGPLGVPGVPSQFNSRNSTVSHKVAPQEKSSSYTNTILAATGGFAAGSVAGYFIKDHLNKRKAKKCYGRKKEDFEDLLNYPAMEQDRICNICDHTCYGPYARCQDCDNGDYDICRDCLSGGALCKGKGQHRLIKIFPGFACDICDKGIRGDFYHCDICNDGEYDVCQKCLDRGWTCHGDGDHELDHLFIPSRKQSGDNNSDSDD